MPEIHCTHAGLKKILKDHMQCLTDKGAWFSPDLAICADNGDLSLKSASGRADRRGFIRLPVALMPLKNGFEFTSSGDSLVCRSISSDNDPVHIQLMEQKTAVYNMCGKLAKWAQASPLSALDEWPDIRRKFFQAKKNAPKIKKYMHLLDKGDKDTVLVDSFLGSRIFNLGPAFLQEPGHKNDRNHQPVFLPVIDYLNHRFQAENFAIQNSPSPVSMQISGKPDPDTHEIFVRYNLYDPVDTFLFYGFVDTHSPWLASVPLHLDLPDGRRLEILNTGGVIKKELPPAVKDLRLYIPTVQDTGFDVIRANKILIPRSAAPRALQRVLGMLLQGLGLGLERRELVQWIEKLENMIIEKNRQWWKELAREAEKLPLEIKIRQDMLELCEYSFGHFDKYQANRQALPDI